MFCDLHNAFDSVNHQILLKKIQFYGIRGKMEMLIQSYLTDRYQRVICEVNFSNCILICIKLTNPWLQDVTTQMLNKYQYFVCTTFNNST
jgi:hypothetical protein